MDTSSPGFCQQILEAVIGFSIALMLFTIAVYVLKGDLNEPVLNSIAQVPYQVTQTLGGIGNKYASVMDLDEEDTLDNQGKTTAANDNKRPTALRGTFFIQNTFLSVLFP